MVMVEIDSSTIPIKPIKQCSDAELIAGVIPCKHILDNEISSAIKDLIKDKYKMTLEVVPPGCHHCNAAEVATHNFEAHFLSILVGVADDFPSQTLGSPS